MSSQTQSKKIRIISIDPGYERLGVAVLEKTNKEYLLFSDCIKTDKKTDHDQRLLQLGKSLESIIEEYNPTELAIETLFFSKNTKTALLVSEVRGLIIYIAKRYGLKVFQYTPNQIKVAVTGSGSSDKNSVINMVSRLIKIDKKKALDDEYDAIACGLTHLASRNFPQH